MDGAQPASKVRTEVQGKIGVITLNDPATLNAAGIELMDGLTAAFEAMVADKAVRAIVITGEGRGFCSGANLSGGGSRITENASGPNQSLIKVYNPFVSAVRKSPKPLVAAVNGVAAGVGASLAMVCDLIVAAESAYFLQAFRRIGLVPDGGATYLLPRLIGWSKAAELIFTGRTLSAAESQGLGLASEVVPDAELQARARAVAAEIAANGPLAVQSAKRLMRMGLEETFNDHVHHVFLQLLPLLKTQDAREGMLAFMEKREPNFRGK